MRLYILLLLIGAFNLYSYSQPAKREKAKLVVGILPILDQDMRPFTRELVL